MGRGTAHARWERLRLKQLAAYRSPWAAISCRAVRSDSPIAPVPSSFDGQSGDWEEIRTALPAAALGRSIKLEFRFISDGIDVAEFAGWYIDDVEVTVP